MIFYRLVLVIILLLITVTGNHGAEADAISLGGKDSATMVTDSAYLKYRLDSMEIEANTLARESIAEHTQAHETILPVIGVMIPIIFLVLLGIVIYRRIEATRVVRLAMIQNGMDPGMLNTSPDENSRKYGALRIGLLLAGVGFGLLVGLLTTQVLGVSEEIAVFSVIGSALLGGGTGLILYHRMIVKMDSKG